MFLVAIDEGCFVSRSFRICCILVFFITVVDVDLQNLHPCLHLQPTERQKKPHRCSSTADVRNKKSSKM